MKLAIRINRCPDAGYEAVCPALPGCVAYAETPERVRERIADAVAGYLASLDVAVPPELEGRLDIESGSEPAAA